MAKDIGSSETLMAAHRAVIENAQNLGMKGFETATRLFELQTQAAQGLMGVGSGAGGASATPADPFAMARGGAEYTQRMAQLLWETQGEMMRLLQNQATQMQALFNEMMASTLQNATALGAAGNRAAEAGNRSAEVAGTRRGKTET